MSNFEETTVLDIDNRPIHTFYHKAKKPRRDNLTVVIFHGAGTSRAERFVPLAQFFLEQGVSVLALDFVGHGKTGMDLRDNSLTLRTKHGIAAINHWLAEGTPLLLLGSSMGAHTALRVSTKFGKRVHSICLLQAAVYASEAENISFTETFTQILRRPGSWKSSLALQDAAHFDGNVYIAIGSADSVIPWEVTEALLAASKEQARTVRFEVFRGVGHELPEWIPEHPQLARQMIDFLLSGS